mmetsp:Transcript_60909/g.149856  ORF Transcript_60909/g.149856 Transcript_60909/m.149856 type:complete len:297 (+) Transcript_60909:3003-3893(+)
MSPISTSNITRSSASLFLAADPFFSARVPTRVKKRVHTDWAPETASSSSSSSSTAMPPSPLASLAPVALAPEEHWITRTKAAEVADTSMPCLPPCIITDPLSDNHASEVTCTKISSTISMRMAGNPMHTSLKKTTPNERIIWSPGFVMAIIAILRASCACSSCSFLALARAPAAAMAQHSNPDRSKNPSPALPPLPTDEFARAILLPPPDLRRPDALGVSFGSLSERRSACSIAQRADWTTESWMSSSAEGQQRTLKSTQAASTADHCASPIVPSKFATPSEIVSRRACHASVVMP